MKLPARGKIASLLRRIAVERGRTTEERVFNAFQELDAVLPDWFHSIEHSTKKQDWSGIDAVVQTDVGALYLQIKSSQSGKNKFQSQSRRHRHPKPIAVVVVSPADSNEMIRQKGCDALKELRERFLQERHRENW